jgi:HEAT repeat protein
MGALLVILALVLVLVLPGVVTMRDVRRTAQAWKQAANELGLKCEKVGTWPVFDWRIRGEIDGLAVTVEKMQSGRKPAMLIQVDGRGLVPRGLVVHREGEWASLKKMVQGEDITTGDAIFDSWVYVQGDEAEALAVLTKPARRAVEDFLDTMSRARVRGGVVECSGQGLGETSEQLVTPVKEAVKVARLLSLDQATPAARLNHNALRDPNRRVRLRNLEVLVRKYAGKRFTLNALRGALKSSDPEARLFALRELGPESVEFMLPVATEDQDPHVRAEALRHLGSFAGERLWPTIEIALRNPHEEVRRAAILAAATTDHVAMVPRIIDQANDAYPVTAEAVAWALGELGDPAAEPALAKLLARDSVEVRRAAATALGLVGTVTAIAPLLASGEGTFTDGELKRAASRAVASIRSRLGNVDAGRLSLVEQQAGALSLAEDQHSPGEFRRNHPEE